MAVVSDTTTTVVALTGFGGSVLVAVTAWKVAAKTQCGENQRKQAEFANQINQVRAARLRELYRPFVELHMVLIDIAKYKGFSFEGSTIGEQDERDIARLRAAEVKASESAAAFELEPDTQETKDAIADAIDYGKQFVHKYGVEKPPGDVHLYFEDLRTLRLVFYKATEDAIRSIRRQLESLDTPVAVRPLDRRWWQRSSTHD